MSKIYVVKITRLVVCEDERQAREIAAKEGNPEDVDEVVEVRDLSDIPEAWKTAQPYGEGEAERRCPEPPGRAAGSSLSRPSRDPVETQSRPCRRVDIRTVVEPASQQFEIRESVQE